MRTDVRGSRVTNFNDTQGGNRNNAIDRFLTTFAPGLRRFSDVPETVHTTPLLDRKFGLNGNVVAQESLGGSLTVGTRVVHFTLNEAKTFGGWGRQKIKTNEVVVKYVPEEAKGSLEEQAMDREIEAHRRWRWSPLKEFMVPAQIAKKEKAIMYPYIHGDDLRKGIKEGKYSFEDVINNHGKIVDKVVDFMSKHKVMTPWGKKKVEIVSMKKLERTIIWEKLSEAHRRTEEVLHLPTESFENSELIFVERNLATNTESQTISPSVNTMAREAYLFLDTRPRFIAKDVDHDISIKNEIYDEYRQKWVRIDWGYKPRKRGEGVDPAEAILVGSKVISLDTVINAEQVQAHREDGSIIVDQLHVAVHPVAEQSEQFMRSRWPDYVRKLDPEVAERIEMYDVISALYEYAHAEERTGGRQELGLFMLKRAGEAFNRYNELKKKRLEKENSNFFRFRRSKRQDVLTV